MAQTRSMAPVRGATKETRLPTTLATGCAVSICLRHPVPAPEGVL